MNLFQKTKILIALNRMVNNIPQPMRLNSSWKTTLWGSGGLVTIVVVTAGQLLDNDPNTNPEWHLVLPVIFALIGNMFSKDYDKSNSPHPIPKAQSVE